MYREWSVSHVPRPYRAAASQALEAVGARRLRNESFFSAPQLKRDPLGAHPLIRMRTRFLFLTGVAGILALAPSCAPMCGVSLVRRVPSPDGRWEAVLFERDCGATTDFATHVSVLRTGAKLPNKQGNQFIADSDHGQAPHVDGNVINVSSQWAGPDSLVVRYDRKARFFS